MSPRHRRRPASHRRRSGRATGLPMRRLALAAGALTVVAGVGAGVAVMDPGVDGAVVAEDGPASDRVASSASPMAEDATPTSASPSATKRPSPRRTKASAKPSPRRTAKKTESRTPTATRTPTVPRSAPAPTRAPAATGEAARIVQLVNQERSKAGCSPLTTNKKLTAAAQKYTDVMADTGVLSHTGPDGSQVSDRVEREGYVWSAVGENIAQGQPDAEAVMDAWMNSQGHRENILNCSFREIGIGVHKGDGGPWWTQDFGTSR
ncbi:CAP domain-containing protein [Streptomyces sp. KR80]|uniref:CAP domain-containing protein n=1 Tax=Streptomyces sp. KR80 TaxID=3457426 RepID=UPI003FD14B4C